MIVSGISGNELFCLHEKGFSAGELVVGNSVCSLGVVGGIGAFGRNLAGGEVANVTSLISEGRHAAIDRMETEAKKGGADGVTSVVSELRTLGGYTEFLSQGTAIRGGSVGSFFSTASSGMELYCHLDAGYHPIRFSMGIVAYALGLGAGLTGSIRTIGRGEVHEFSEMYNGIRHTALQRLREEASKLGANAVVDVKVRLLPYGPGAVELLMTGTAAFHPALSAGPVAPNQVRTSELTGEELWNLARMGYVPVQLCMAVSVYSIGVVGGIGAMIKGLGRGEIPELTSLVYGARENCIDVLRHEAERFGAAQVIGNKLTIRELMPGLIEVMAIGTAVEKREGMTPSSPVLIPQAIILERDSLELDPLSRGEANIAQTAMTRTRQLASAPSALVRLGIVLMIMMITGCMGFVPFVMALLQNR